MFSIAIVVTAAGLSTDPGADFLAERSYDQLTGVEIPSGDQIFAGLYGTALGCVVTSQKSTSMPGK